MSTVFSRRTCNGDPCGEIFVPLGYRISNDCPLPLAKVVKKAKMETKPVFESRDLIFTSP
jgi:hypothetical protein